MLWFAARCRRNTWGCRRLSARQYTDQATVAHRRTTDGSNVLPVHLLSRVNVNVRYTVWHSTACRCVVFEPIRPTNRHVSTHQSFIIHRRSQDFLWECTFFPQNVDDLFLVVVLNTRAKTDRLTTSTLQPSPAQQKFPLKNWLGNCALHPPNYTLFSFVLKSPVSSLLTAFIRNLITVTHCSEIQTPKHPELATYSSCCHHSPQILSLWDWNPGLKNRGPEKPNHFGKPKTRCNVVRPIQKSIGKWEIGPM